MDTAIPRCLRHTSRSRCWPGTPRSRYAYGFCMGMWFWLLAPAAQTQLFYLAGTPSVENRHRFVPFTVATSPLGWDTGRAIANAAAVAVLAPAVLATLRRAPRRAAFDAPLAFTPAHTGSGW